MVESKIGSEGPLPIEPPPVTDEKEFEKWLEANVHGSFGWAQDVEGYSWSRAGRTELTRKQLRTLWSGMRGCVEPDVLQRRLVDIVESLEPEE